MTTIFCALSLETLELSTGVSSTTAWPNYCFLLFLRQPVATNTVSRSEIADWFLPLYGIQTQMTKAS